MLEKIQKAEEALVRVETWILAACLLTMLVLAGYNVFYRNVLVPWQVSLKSSGPPVTEQEAGSGESGSEESGSGGVGSGESGSEESGGFGGGFGGGETDEESTDEDEAGGFGGGFGAGDEQEKETDQKESNDDAAGGFGGGFGGNKGGDEADKKEESDDSAGGFGGGFGGEDGEKADEGAGDDASGGFGGGFGGGGDEPTDSEKGEPGEGDETPTEEADEEPVAAEEPEGGPPPEGSFGAFMIDAIDAVKLSWIDIFIRQLVLIVGFLGALLATRRREHITIDAVGQIITGRTRHIVDTVTSSFALVICAVLAVSGWRLVAIGMEWPRELLPWAMEWHFQLAFPVGFGMMALHFALRTLESGVMAYRDMPVEETESAVETPDVDDIDDDDIDDDNGDEPDEEEKSTDEQGGES